LINVSPNDDDWWDIAKNIFARFLARPGADHIASPYALAHLAAILRQADINSVVEFGAGIGTVTYLRLTHPSPSSRTVVTPENNAFCLEQLQRNIPAEFKSRLTVLSGLRQPNGRFDLAIIDGKIPPDEDYAFLRPGLV
jgi:predicted O-methyltransferase YrrM